MRKCALLENDKMHQLIHGIHRARERISQNVHLPEPIIASA